MVRQMLVKGEYRALGVARADDGVVARLEDWRDCEFGRLARGQQWSLGEVRKSARRAAMNLL
jgi:hypothetical protein